MQGTPQEIASEMQRLIEEKIENSTAEVKAISPGHFEISVKASVFAELSKVKQQQLVYSTINHLIVGEQAPVHAIDTMKLSAN